MSKQGPYESPQWIRGQHLKDSQLEWIDFDPSRLAALARSLPDVPEGLGDRLASRTQAAWECAAYIAFQPRPHGRVTSVVLEASEGDYVVDVDSHGNPVGVELLSVAMGSEDH